MNSFGEVHLKMHMKYFREQRCSERRKIRTQDADRRPTDKILEIS